MTNLAYAPRFEREVARTRTITVPELSIIIPSLDEAASLPALLAELNTICIESSLDVETIVSDDASEDETLRVAGELQSRYPDLNLRVLHRYAPRHGYGAVVRYGLAHATGRFAVIVAADGQNPLHLLPRMLSEARNGAQLVQCSRYDKDGDNKDVATIFKVYQRVYRGLTKVLLGKTVSDSTYGFKLFDRVLGIALGANSNRFNLSPEITFKVLLAGGKIVFVSGSRAPRTADQSKFRLYRELDGYLYVLMRAWLHRLGFLWF
jgi:glycosyltransferase involved in cell wall biosynthesis